MMTETTTETKTESPLTEDQIIQQLEASIETKGSVAETAEDRPGLLDPPSVMKKPDASQMVGNVPITHNPEFMMQVVNVGFRVAMRYLSVRDQELAYSMKKLLYLAQKNKVKI